MIWRTPAGEALPPEVGACLLDHHVLHLSTGAHSTPLFFARSEGGLCWISDPGTEHAQATQEVGASVAPSAPPLHSFIGLQLRGTVVCPAHQGALREAYLQRFPQAEPLMRLASHHRLYELRPTWIRLMVREQHLVRRQTFQVVTSENRKEN